MQSHKLNKAKKIICALVVFSLVLQIGFYPVVANAAEAGLWAKLKRIFSKISVPDQVIFTKEGNLKIGTNTSDKWTIDIFKGEENNPLNNIGALIFGPKKTNPLITEGKLNIVNPQVPEACQLGLIKPIEKGGEGLSEDEQMARRRACNYLIRLQEAAAQEAFVAKSIYAKTDPTGDCLFLKNCKSVCSLRFGEVRYTVTIFDIAEFLLPTGWMSVVHKIINIVAMFGKVKDVLTMAQTIFKDGVGLVNSAISTFNYLANLYAALDNLGGSLSASLGVGALVVAGSVAGGADIPSANIITGVAAGAAGAGVLAKSFGGMKEMLGRFADNMMAYSQAKTEAGQALLAIKKDLTDIIEGNDNLKGLKKEEKLAFLFKPQNENDQQKKDLLDKAVTDYRAFFENSTELLNRMLLPGQLLGQTVLEVNTGAVDEFGVLNANEKAFKGYNFGEPVETVYGDRAFSQSACSNGSVGPGVEYAFNSAYESALGTKGEGPNLVRITEPEYIIGVLDKALGANSPDALNYKMSDLNETKGAWQVYWEDIGKIVLGQTKLNDITNLADNTCNKACRLGFIQFEVINKTSPDGRITPFRVLKEIAALDRNGENGTRVGNYYMPNKGPNINYQKDNNRQKTISFLKTDYASDRLSSFLETIGNGDIKVCAFVGDRVSPWPSSCPEGSDKLTMTQELAVFKGLTAMENSEAFYINSVNQRENLPSILEVIASALGGVDGNHYKEKVLNYKKLAWAERWEAIAGNVLPFGRVGEIKSNNAPEKAHQILMSECVAKHPFLGYLRAFEGNWYGNDGAVAITEKNADFFTMQRAASNVFPITCNVNQVGVAGASWLKTFQKSYSDIFGLADFYSKTSSGYLEDWLLRGVPAPLFDCFEGEGDCTLNEKNEVWLQYWQRLASLINPATAQSIAQDTNLLQRLTNLQNLCIIHYAPLQILVLLQAEIGKNQGWSNTKILIEQRLGQYKIARDDPRNNAGLKFLTKGNVLTAVNDIAQLQYHDQDLETNKRQTDPPLGPRFVNGEYRKYWKSEIWCGTECSASALTKFTETYDSSIAEMEWGGWIKAIAQAPKSILLVDEAIQAGLSPEEPLINYKIEKVNKAFFDVVKKVSKEMEKSVGVAMNKCWAYFSYKQQKDDYLANKIPQKDCSNAEWSCCENLSDCQQKITEAVSFCGTNGVPPVENTYDKDGRYIPAFNDWSSIYSKYNKTFGAWYSRFNVWADKYENAYFSNYINDIQVIVKALDFIWQNDMSITAPIDKAEALKGVLSHMTNPWSAGYLTDSVKSYYQGLAPVSQKESEIIRKHVANILATSFLSGQLISYNGWGIIDNYERLFKSNDWETMLSVDQMIAEINNWSIPETEKKKLIALLEDEFSPALSSVKAETIESFKKNIGRYAFTNSFSVNFEDYPETEICPSDIETQGFLSRISCLEKKNNLTLEMVKGPLKAITKVENAIFNLADADFEAEGVASVRQSINNLKPILKTDMAEINANMAEDFSLAKVKDIFRSVWNKYSAVKKYVAGGTDNADTEVKITSDDTSIKNWDDLKKALLNNPITFLQGEFQNIETQITTIRNDLSSASSEMSPLWPSTGYSEAISDVQYTRIPKLLTSVFGNQEKRDVCQGFSVLMSAALPQEIEKTCKLVSDGGKVNNDILNDVTLNNDCLALEKTFETDTSLNSSELEDKIQKLEETRKCITQETCPDQLTKCLKCPDWFCLKNGKWTSDDTQDQKCATKPAGLYNHIIWNTALQMRDRQWPPKTGCPCSEGYNTFCFAQKYQGAQDLCIENQLQLESYKSQRISGGASAQNREELTEKCKELNYQKALKTECESFQVAKGASQNDCNSVPSGEQRTACLNLRAQAKEKLCFGSVIANIDCSRFPGGFPDLTSSAPENQEALSKIKDICYEVQDIKTPLNEVMKVYSVLIGIRSGTLAYGGIKTSIADAKKLMENVQKFIKMVEELPKKMKAAFDDANKNTAQGGIKITPLKCIAKPAESYDSVSGRIKTGPEGGQVCPEVGTLYKQLQSQFSVIRNQLHLIDLSRREVSEINIPLWKQEKYIHIFDAYPIRHQSIDPLYDRAQSIKEKSQYVWALATAIDFANQQCTCGQSFCKLPFCISGLPLTLQPLKDPYCSLVWILRSPMERMAESLNQELITLPDNIQ